MQKAAIQRSAEGAGQVQRVLAALTPTRVFPQLRSDAKQDSLDPVNGIFTISDSLKKDI
jgi:hypothetical protein